jgi:hypothetical protein
MSIMFFKMLTLVFSWNTQTSITRINQITFLEQVLMLDKALESELYYQIQACTWFCLTYGAL